MNKKYIKPSIIIEDAMLTTIMAESFKASDFEAGSDLDGKVHDSDEATSGAWHVDSKSSLWESDED